ncbi:hypothetical protein BASA61_008377 [Batrachochytrium salamandrivorans]|nr:hypothetical protein BASA61_008377 [Batrachochytrium salamandrivorans]
MSEEDLTSVSFKDTAFLQVFGLNEHNALDYFAMSQFYDKSCLNEQLKMQVRHNDLQAQQLDGRQMKGLEYTIWYFTLQPSLFVIRKQTRFSPTRVDLIAVYYIVEGTVYQAPNLCQVLANRVRTSLFFTKNALQIAKESYRHNPILGYSWSNEPDLFEQLQSSLAERQKSTQQEDLTPSGEIDDVMDVDGANGADMSRSGNGATANVTSLGEQHRATQFIMTVDQLISNSNEWYKAPSATAVSGESLMIPHEIASVSGASPASIVTPIETTRLSPPNLSKTISQRSKSSSGKRQREFHMIPFPSISIISSISRT